MTAKKNYCRIQYSEDRTKKDMESKSVPITVIWFNLTKNASISIKTFGEKGKIDGSQNYTHSPEVNGADYFVDLLMEYNGVIQLTLTIGRKKLFTQYEIKTLLCTDGVTRAIPIKVNTCLEDVQIANEYSLEWRPRIKPNAPLTGTQYEMFSLEGEVDA